MSKAPKYAKENYELSQHLNRLWKDNHLTRNHSIVIAHPANLNRVTFHYLIWKGDEIYQPNQKLEGELGGITKSYKFDRLEMCPCQCECGQILFVRTLHGKELLKMADEFGNLDEVPTNGVRQEFDRRV